MGRDTDNDDGSNTESKISEGNNSTALVSRSEFFETPSLISTTEEVLVESYVSSDSSVIGDDDKETTHEAYNAMYKECLKVKGSNLKLMDKLKKREK